MAVITADRFNRNNGEQWVKLNRDQKIKGVPLNTGDECSLPVGEALYLKNSGRVEFIAGPSTPKKAER